MTQNIHSIEATFEPKGWRVGLKAVCSDPTADCHYYCAEDCEQWSDLVRNEDGRVLWHEYVNDDEGTVDHHQMDHTDDCGFVVALNDSDMIDELMDGEPLTLTIPADFTFDGDGTTWTARPWSPEVSSEQLNGVLLADGILDRVEPPRLVDWLRIINAARALPGGEPKSLVTGAELVAAERRRQVEVEGYSIEHDMEHGPDALRSAARSYVWGDLKYWPWDAEWFKPKDRLSDLIRAGALFLASRDVAEAMGEKRHYRDGERERCEFDIDAILATARRLTLPGGERAECTGASDCIAQPHEHGCFADRGDCTDPADHTTPPAPSSPVDQVEAACEVMHDAYEAAAVEAGWETQERSRKPWSDVPEANKATMRAAVTALLAHLSPVDQAETITQAVEAERRAWIERLSALCDDDWLRKRDRCMRLAGAHGRHERDAEGAWEHAAHDIRRLLGDDDEVRTGRLDAYRDWMLNGRDRGAAERCEASGGHDRSQSYDFDDTTRFTCPKCEHRWSEPNTDDDSARSHGTGASQ